MLRRLWLACRVATRVFGTRILPLPVALVFLLYHLTVEAALLLDHVLFPRLRRTQLDKPIVIVGNPRSGTTFLHRFLDDCGIGSGMELWQIVCPALSMQVLLRPFRGLIGRFSPTRFYSQAIHETSLQHVETDDALFLLHCADGILPYCYFFAFDEEDHSQRLNPGNQRANRRDFRWLRRVWRRHRAAQPDLSTLAKLFSLGPRLPAFLDEFPDARIVYLIRDPLSTIPSSLRLATTLLDARFGFWSLPETVRRRYLDRVYRGLVNLYRGFYDDWSAGRLEHRRVFVCPYDRLINDFEPLVRELLDFLEVPLDTEILERTVRTAQQQRTRVSQHHYELARFGFDEQRIRDDCAFVYEAFLGDKRHG